MFPQSEELATAVITRLRVEDALDLSDAELERTLSPCCGGQNLVRTAKAMRDAGMLHCKCDPCVSPKWMYCPTCYKYRSDFNIPTAPVAASDTINPTDWSGVRGTTGGLQCPACRGDALGAAIEQQLMNGPEWTCDECQKRNTCGNRRCLCCGLWRSFLCKGEVAVIP